MYCISDLTHEELSSQISDPQCGNITFHELLKMERKFGIIIVYGRLSSLHRGLPNYLHLDSKFKMLQNHPMPIGEELKVDIWNTILVSIST